MRQTSLAVYGCALLTAAVACVHAPPVASSATGASLDVVFPGPQEHVTGPSFSLVFGQVTPPSLEVSVNGVHAQRAATGGFLAHVPVAPGPFTFHVEAREPGAQVASLAAERTVTVGGYLPSWNDLLDPSTVLPKGPIAAPPGAHIELAFLGRAGLEAAAVLGTGVVRAPFVPSRAPSKDAGLVGPSEAPGPVWYRAELTLPALRGPMGSTTTRSGNGNPAPMPAALAIEIADASGAPRRFTLPATLTLQDPSVDPVAELSASRATTPGFPLDKVRGYPDPPPGGTFTTFLSNGTRVRLGQRQGGFVEARLSDAQSVWVASADAHVLPPGTPRPFSRAYSLRVLPLPDGWARVVIRLDEPIPVEVEQYSDGHGFRVTLHSAVAAQDLDAVLPGTDAAAVKSVAWHALGRETLELQLTTGRCWGFRYGFSGTDFYLDLKPPPPPLHGLFPSPFQGLTIAVDPGHSRGTGAVGPTRLVEKDVNWAVASRLVDKLRGAGARVVLSRMGEATPEQESLVARSELALREHADLFVSVHHNASPDSMDPFRAPLGSSSYFYEPQSRDLALALQQALLKGLAFPDSGLGRANFAVARITELPAVLTEAAYVMLPEQEALLRTKAFQEREAEALYQGIRRFLLEARNER